MRQLIILITVFVLLCPQRISTQDYTLEFDAAGTYSGTYISGPLAAGTISGNYWTRIAIARDSLYSPDYNDPIRLLNSASLIGNPIAGACLPLSNGIGNTANEGPYASLPENKVLLITNNHPTESLEIVYWDRGDGPLYNPGFQNNAYRFACNRPDDGAIPQPPADKTLAPGESIALLRTGLIIEAFPFCDAGEFSNGTTCEECQAGLVQPEMGQMSCIPCLEGEFQDIPGQTACKVCPPGTYQDAQGQVECKTCPQGLTSEAGAIICVLPIPTLSQWALIILGISLSILGIFALKKRKLELQ